jgi:uncharacterized protein YpmS
VQSKVNNSWNYNLLKSNNKTHSQLSFFLLFVCLFVCLFVVVVVVVVGINKEESSVESAVPLRAVTDASNKPTTESASDALRLSTYLFQMDYFEKTVPPDKLEELKNQVSRTFDNETSIMRSPLLELVSNGGRSIFTQNVQRVEGNPGFLPTTSSTLMSYWRESKVYLISMLIAGTFAVALPVMSSSSSWRLQSGLSSLFTPLASFFHHLFWIDSATV